MAEMCILNCPNCGGAVNIDVDEISAEIAKLNNDIADINMQIAINKAQYGSGRKYRPTEWYTQAKKAVVIKQKQASKLKIQRESLRNQIEKNRDVVFRRLVKKELGIEKYVELAKMADEIAASEGVRNDE